MHTADVIIVGAGVLGTFHAYHAIQQGLKVILLEKNTQPRGATVRNFGQVVPSGMPQGTWQQYGLESTRIYKEIQDQFDISVRQQGSLYIASNEAELGLLEELHGINHDNNYASHLLTRAECLAHQPSLKTSYCQGGLFFPEEITVEPQLMIHQLISYLTTQGMSYHPQTPVIRCEVDSMGVKVEDSHGRVFHAAKVLICNGSEFQLLLPEVFASSDLEVSKLQMMRTVPQADIKLPGSLLTGLTIRRYESFQECPSYAALDSDYKADLHRWGIHILFKQSRDGAIIIGDSHEYADAKASEQLDFAIRSDINQLILTEAKRIIDLAHWQISSSWLGFYAQCKTQAIFNEEVHRNVHVVTGIGGKGMTTSAGFAQDNVKRIFNTVSA